MNKLSLIICFSFIAFNTFAQEKTPQNQTSQTPVVPTTSPAEEPTNMDAIAGELESTGALVERIAAEQDSEEVKPTIDAILSDGGSNLIQFDQDNFKQEEDIYPVLNFHGTFLYTIPDIQKAYQMENIEQVKASLDRWYQNDRNTFPVEGFVMLATIYDQFKMYTKAQSLLEEGGYLADNDQKVIFDINRSQVLRHSGQNKEALKILDNLGTNVGLKQPEIFFYKALSYLYLKSNDLAILNLRKYLEIAPQGPQNVKVRRAIAWLILNRNGQVTDQGGNSAGREENLEKMLQLLVDKQLTEQVGELIKSTSSAVDTRALDIQNKELEDFADYTNIVD